MTHPQPEAPASGWLLLIPPIPSKKDKTIFHIFQKTLDKSPFCVYTNQALAKHLDD